MRPLRVVVMRGKEALGLEGHRMGFVFCDAIEREPPRYHMQGYLTGKALRARNTQPASGAARTFEGVGVVLGSDEHEPQAARVMILPRGSAAAHLVEEEMKNRSE